MREECVEPVMPAPEARALIGTFSGARRPTESLRLRAGEDLVVRDADSGQVVLGLGTLPTAMLGALHRSITANSAVFTTTLRQQLGYRNVSVTFGYKPKAPAVKRESCRASRLDDAAPALRHLLGDVADWCGTWMAEHLPEVVAADDVTLAPVVPDWRLTEAEGHLWTSGVINKNSAMPYHTDRNNFPTWSAMPTVRTKVRGGHLHLPEYDLVVPTTDGQVLFWWGQRYVHGVTPMTVERGGYRYTVVYYAIRGMKDCATYAMDTAAGRARRTARESAIAARVAVGDVSLPGGRPSPGLSRSIPTAP